MKTAAWWKERVIYEVLVPSFQDSNGDGIGDLCGVRERLDYLKWLGVGVLWLSPICKTGMVDIGYDVIDFCTVDTRFGTFLEFSQLLTEAHRADLRIIVDFVPNHTSREHEWFQQSRSGVNNSYRHFYIWSDPAPDGGAPNNWINRFGQSAWTFDELTGQYYFGTFSPEQPDLNWRSDAVVNAMMDALRFWLKSGADGIRVDALAHLMKDVRLRNNPRNAEYTPEQEPSNRLVPFYSQNQPELWSIISTFKETVAEFEDRLFLGEVFQTPEQLAAYARAGADLLLSTSLMQSKFEPVALQSSIDHLESIMGLEGWPARASGDHDLKRLATRVAAADLRMAALLSFAVRGTPTMVYGEELGLKDTYIPADKAVDPSGRQTPRYNRDVHRIPMPWDATEQAGFTTGKPWLPIDADTLGKNVAGQREDSESLLCFYQRLLQLRKREVLLHSGDYAPLVPPENVLAFERYLASDPSAGKLVIILNFNKHPIHWPNSSGSAQVLLSTSEIEPREQEPVIVVPPRTGLIMRSH